MSAHILHYLLIKRAQEKSFAQRMGIPESNYSALRESLGVDDEMAERIAKRMEKGAEVTLDIEKGDTLLFGRFKNKPHVVEEFGTDEKGQPTVNGMKLLACRIKKKMPGSKTAMSRADVMEFYLRRALRAKTAADDLNWDPGKQTPINQEALANIKSKWTRDTARNQRQAPGLDAVRERVGRTYMMRDPAKPISAQGKAPEGYNPSAAPRPLFGRALPYLTSQEDQFGGLPFTPKGPYRKLEKMEGGYPGLLSRADAKGHPIGIAMAPGNAFYSPGFRRNPQPDDKPAPKGIWLGDKRKYPGIYAHEYTHRSTPTENLRPHSEAKAREISPGGKYGPEIPAMIVENIYGMLKAGVPPEALAAQTKNSDESWVYNTMLKHGPKLDPSTQQITPADRKAIENFAQSIYNPDTELGGRYRQWLSTKGDEVNN